MTMPCNEAVSKQVASMTIKVDGKEYPVDLTNKDVSVQTCTTADGYCKMMKLQSTRINLPYCAYIVSIMILSIFLAYGIYKIFDTLSKE